MSEFNWGEFAKARKAADDELEHELCWARCGRDHALEELAKVTAERDEAIKLRDQYSLVAFETLLQLVKEKMR